MAPTGRAGQKARSQAAAEPSGSGAIEPPHGDGALDPAEPSPPDARERILEAALAAFAERGFDGATTRDIATRADVNLGLIKYYFDGKLNLWKSAVDRAFERLLQSLDGDGEIVPDPDPADALREQIRRTIRFAAANPEFIRLMHDEGKRGGPRMKWLVDRHVRSLYETTTAVLSAAQAQGAVPKGIALVHLHYILLGAVALIFHQAEECRRLSGLDPSQPEVVEAHAEAVVQLLLRGRPGRTGAAGSAPRRDGSTETAD